MVLLGARIAIPTLCIRNAYRVLPARHPLFDFGHLVRVPLLVYAVAVIGYVLVEPGPVGGLI